MDFFSGLPGDFALKNAGDLWRFFSSLRFPRNEARKLLKKFGENSEQNSGQNSGRKFEKFGELSFCDFSDLTFSKGMRLFCLQLEASCLTVELLPLQLTILAFLLTVGAFLLTIWALLLTVGAFWLTVGKCV